MTTMFLLLSFAAMVYGSSIPDNSPRDKTWLTPKRVLMYGSTFALFVYVSLGIFTGVW